MVNQQAAELCQEEAAQRQSLGQQAEAQLPATLPPVEAQLSASQPPAAVRQLAAVHAQRQLACAEEQQLLLLLQQQQQLAAEADRARQQAVAAEGRAWERNYRAEAGAACSGAWWRDEHCRAQRPEAQEESCRSKK